MIQHAFPGLIQEKMPSGAIRWRVRVEGNKHKRIGLTIGPDHPEFREAYLAARRGDAERAQLARSAMEKLQGMEW